MQKNSIVEIHCLVKKKKTSQDLYVCLLVFMDIVSIAALYVYATVVFFTSHSTVLPVLVSFYQEEQSML